ncbi:MAG: copper amine oxidase N-terminal domain-containing protein, partial [Bacteroidota bacterium]
MNNKLVKILIGTVLLLCLGAFVLAASPIKLFVNGQEIVTEVAPKIVDGKVLAPLGVIAEVFGAKVNWDEKSKSVFIEVKETEAKQSQVRLLEEALAPKDPLNAAETWARGVKTRNGALQYAVMSPELKKEHFAKFVDSNWSTGVSSPWVESYEITEKHNFNNEIFRFEIEFSYTDSTKSAFS